MDELEINSPTKRWNDGYPNTFFNTTDNGINFAKIIFIQIYFLTKVTNLWQEYSLTSTVTLPSVKYDAETGTIDVDDTIRTPLKVHGLPVPTSFAVYKSPQR